MIINIKINVCIIKDNNSNKYSLIHSIILFTY